MLPSVVKKRLIAGLFAALFAISGTAQADSRLVTQNWAESAVYYSSPCDETETFRMSGEEFLAYRIDLENRLVYAYSVYFNALDGEAAETLKASQKAWIECYYAYIEALEQLWLEPVKIHFGVTGHERRTNLYREILLLMLINRITDLEEWHAGRLVGLEAAAAEEKAAELNEAKRQLQVDMGLCLYVIDEEYRAKIMDSHRAFFAFLEANEEFVSIIAQSEEQIIGESLLQVDRMAYITGAHYEGCRFFRREREE